VARLLEKYANKRDQRAYEFQRGPAAGTNRADLADQTMERAHSKALEDRRENFMQGQRARKKSLDPERTRDEAQAEVFERIIQAVLLDIIVNDVTLRWRRSSQPAFILM
jgi:hypothetical protein